MILSFYALLNNNRFYSLVNKLFILGFQFVTIIIINGSKIDYIMRKISRNTLGDSFSIESIG